MIHARVWRGKEVGTLRRIGSSGWPSRSGPRWLGGSGLALGGALLIFKVFPVWIWPLGLGLWLMWAGLGPIVVGGALIWLGWRLLSSSTHW